MKRAVPPDKNGASGFRTKLFVALMLVVSALTGLGLYLAQRKVAATAEHDLRQNFEANLSWLHQVQKLRHTALVERCRELVSKPRIHAALEDNALDLLYPTAKDELRDLIKGEERPEEETSRSLHARFYRFLDATGRVLPPPNRADVGDLSESKEAALSLKQLPDTQQIGYIVAASDAERDTIDEVLALPIFSTETGETISALAVGFKPFELTGRDPAAKMRSGIWLNGQLHMSSFSKSAQSVLGREITDAVANSGDARNNLTVMTDGVPQLLFYKHLNPDSFFPPAYEVCVYPLSDSMAQLRRLRWQIGGAGTILLLGGFVASHFIALRLARPVEKLAIDSEQNRAMRERAEAALQSTSEELERSARYSADASHQLKSPVTVLRAGLETLLARDGFQPETYRELFELLHHTHRLTSVIDDLLLLSQMDAGHLQIARQPVNLSRLIDEWLDDLGALPDSIEVKIEKELPPDLYIAGERRYTSLIVQNLLENARKYNRPGGRLRVVGRQTASEVIMTIGNSGRTINPAAQEHIFKRFHRAPGGQPVAGHGLGLNLARDLARLHGGDLTLVRSDNDWTEFELRFPISVQPANNRTNVA